MQNYGISIGVQCIDLSLVDKLFFFTNYQNTKNTLK